MPLLVIYDQKREVKTLIKQYDKSWRRIAQSSRELADTERRYSQIKKESPLGKVTTLLSTAPHGAPAQTDHKPLGPIVKTLVSSVELLLNYKKQQLQHALLSYNMSPIHCRDHSTTWTARSTTGCTTRTACTGRVWKLTFRGSLDGAKHAKASLPSVSRTSRMRPSPKQPWSQRSGIIFFSLASGTQWRRMPIRTVRRSNTFLISIRRWGPTSSRAHLVYTEFPWTCALAMASCLILGFSTNSLLAASLFAPHRAQRLPDPTG